MLKPHINQNIDTSISNLINNVNMIDL